MSNIKTEYQITNKNGSYSKCCYCQAKITPENEVAPRMDYRETDILNLKQQIQNYKGVIKSLQQELDENEKKL